MNWVNRHEIDTSPPLRSVKEAGFLFGERGLAGEVYTAKSKEIGEIAAELEETKLCIEKAREQGTPMAKSLTLLEEQAKTKKELQDLKKHEHGRKMEGEKEIDDVKFNEPSETNNENEAEFQKRRYMTFASPPILQQTVIPRYEESLLQKHPPLDEKKKHNKKTLLPLIGGLLHMKKQGNEVAPAAAAVAAARDR